MFFLLPGDKTNSFLHLFSTQPSSLFLRNARLKTLSLPNKQNFATYTRKIKTNHKSLRVIPEFKTEQYIGGSAVIYTLHYPDTRTSLSPTPLNRFIMIHSSRLSCPSHSPRRDLDTHRHFTAKG